MTRQRRDSGSREAEEADDGNILAAGMCVGSPWCLRSFLTTNSQYALTRAPYVCTPRESNYLLDLQLEQVGT